MLYQLLLIIELFLMRNVAFVRNVVFRVLPKLLDFCCVWVHVLTIELVMVRQHLSRQAVDYS